MLLIVLQHDLNGDSEEDLEEGCWADLGCSAFWMIISDPVCVLSVSEGQM